jgi:ABC-type sugar transport system substrate-binding protein
VLDLTTDKIKVAYIPISTAGATNSLVDIAFQDTIETYKDNIQLDYFDPGYDVQTQITMVNDCVNQGYNAILIECADPISLSTPVADAEAAGVACITLNLNAETVHTLHIRGVDYLAGWTAAEVLAEDFGKDSGKNVVIIDCPAPMAATNLQSAGFEDYMNENTNWNLLDLRNIDNFSQEGANTAMRDVLTVYDNIDIVYCMMDDITAGTLQALEAAGKADGSIVVYGNIGGPGTLGAIKNGNKALYGLTLSDYYTEMSIAMAMAMYFAETGITAVSMGLDATPQIALKVFPITPDNAADMITISRWPQTGML